MDASNLPCFVSPRAFSASFLAKVSLAAVLVLGAGSGLNAQPSGGPYGPVQLRYELPAAKHVYFVAPEGKTDASGNSVEQPTTLENAITRVITGDAIVLRGGIYRTGGLKLNQGVTIQPYADERPVLKGTDVATDWKAQPNGLWRTAWKKVFPAQPADWWRRERHGRETPVYLFNNDMVFIDGKLLRAVGGEHEMSADSYFIDYVAGQVYLGTNPEGHLVEITSQDSALVRTIGEAHGKSSDRQGPVIRGITFTQYAYRALEVEGTEPMKHADPSTFGNEVVGTTLENVTISFCSRVAGYFRGDKLVIRNCFVADCGTEGLYVIDSADVLLEKNIITRTNAAEKIAGYYASAVKIFNQSYRVTVRDNLVIDNQNSSGVWYDVGNVDGVFVNNWVERTNDGFFFEISKGAICAGNVFVDCDHGVRVLNSSNVQVYQNTFYNADAFFDRTERSAVGDHFGWHPSAGPDVDQRQGHVFVNNLLAADNTFQGALLRFDQSEAVRARLKEPHVKQLDGNVYVRRNGAKPQPLIRWAPVANDKGFVELATIDELRKLQPQFENHAQLLNDYWGPLFQSVELNRFSLAAGFPGVHAGVSIPDTIRELLKLNKDQAAFPGAYAP